MITLEGSRLVVRFARLRADAVAAIEFQRTLRIPDDDSTYPPPPGLGAETGETPLPANQPTEPAMVTALGPDGHPVVREGTC